MLAATWFTAIATGLLAIFAVVTAWYARKAFREQSEEVRTLKEQLSDQRALSMMQTPVLELQAKELQESLAERIREAQARRRAQASQVFAWNAVHLTDVPEVLPGASQQEWTAAAEQATRVPSVDIRNTSTQPVYDVLVEWLLEDGRILQGDYRGTPLMPGEEESVPEPAPPRLKDAPDPAPGVFPGLNAPPDRHSLSAQVTFRDASGVRWLRDPRTGDLTEWDGYPPHRSARTTA